jgi:hypothetical protein
MPDLILTYAGIRALPAGSFPPQNYADGTNVAVLHYLLAFDPEPKSDPNQNIPQSVLPLIETNLHVGFMSLSYECN